MRKFEPSLLPLHVGSIPHTDPQAACELVLEHFSHIPTWPQLPRRTFLENMYVQFSEGFPSVVLEDERIYVDRGRDLDPGLERLYLAYLENDLSYGTTSPDYAAGLAAFPQKLSAISHQPLAIKGQVTGPISWGLTMVDQDRRPVLYDDILADALAKHLRLKAAWQEQELRQIAPTTLVFIDEPYMSAFGSAYISLNREQVITLLEEVFAGLTGIKGTHCCGNTDWSLLLSTSAEIISFDTYSYAQAFSLYAGEVKAFLKRGGIIAWGIVPADDEKALMSETVESLVARLHEAMNLLVRKGISFDELINASLITPSCGLRTLSEEAAERAFELTVGISETMRERYGT
ncbi:MAG: methionine synthase [Anaerolineae bacterium]|nr:methionine synthase [Anaerolineae bacterium]